MSADASPFTGLLGETDEAALEPSNSQHRIVVGIDGSAESKRALDWAITYATQSGVVLSE